MGRRIVGCLLALLMAALPGLAEDEEAARPQYVCVVRVNCALRREPGEAARRVGGADAGEAVEVLAYGSEWSLCRAGDSQGYLKNSWLYRFRSLDPFNCPQPGYAMPAGYGRVISPTRITAADYGGNALATGDVVVLAAYRPLLCRAAIHREEYTLSGQCFAFTPFLRWDEAGPGEAIGGHTTYFSCEAGGRLAANRQYNIDLAAERISGVVVAPGEVFSFNAHCAPYTKANGYKEAPVISSSMATGHGGGVCQVSTALYNALLATPLLILERRPHRDAGVYYAPVDFDAAVSTTGDFRFQNTLPYPIEIRATDQKGVLTVLILAGEGAVPGYLVADE